MASDRMWLVLLQVFSFLGGSWSLMPTGNAADSAFYSYYPELKDLKKVDRQPHMFLPFEHRSSLRERDIVTKLLAHETLNENKRNNFDEELFVQAVNTTPSSSKGTKHSSNDVDDSTATTTTTTTTTTATTATATAQPVLQSSQEGRPNWTTEYNIVESDEYDDSHRYYNSTFVVDESTAKEYWIDLNNQPDLKVNTLHGQSHEKEASVKLKFDFPFYGHKLRDVNVAVRGLLWLGANRHIAPLMANFSLGLSNESVVKYADNGTAFTVTWERVSLQDKPKAGAFTFQVTLLQNGDIIFVYARIPIALKDIEDSKDPFRIGLSDTDIMDTSALFVRRKTVSIRHQIFFNCQDIRDWTVIYLKALPISSDMKSHSHSYEDLQRLRKRDVPIEQPLVNVTGPKFEPKASTNTSPSTNVSYETSEDHRPVSITEKSVAQNERTTLTSPPPPPPPPASKPKKYYENSNNTAADESATTTSTTEQFVQSSQNDLANVASSKVAEVTPETMLSTDDEISINKFSDPSKTDLSSHNITKTLNDTHQYYNSTFIVDKAIGKKYWIDLDSHPNVEANTLLSQSHRRAATVKLKFDFPFYGHKVRNITIATGGFLYTGEYVHSWLAATQYIAPLMANFDTRLSKESVVKYADNGTAFTVTWEKVFLQDKPKAGAFTFQVTLLQNGDIIFVYSLIPVMVESIEDTTHPVKVGLSDAYIMDRTVFFVRRKTIYEYHRVAFNRQDIKNYTVIYLKALPTCLDMDNCNDCLTKITDFECKWCPGLNQCSTGTFRYRQEWLEKGCEIRNINSKSNCPAKDVSVMKTTNHEGHVYTDGESSASVESSNQQNKVPAVSSLGHARDNMNMSVSGVIGILLVISLVAGLAAWVVYAYRNPHSASGQMLIRYRPSQWSWRRGEARYTAATIHM